MFEQWESVSAVEAFRGAGPSDDQADVARPRRARGDGRHGLTSTTNTARFDESMVEQATLRYLRELVDSMQFGPQLAPRLMREGGLLATYDFPPDQEARTVELVLQQAEPFAGT
jgi:hypothetical protein